MCWLSFCRSDSHQEYHKWLLHVYENVYEGSLKSLLQKGLIELIQELFKKEMEDCDFEKLKCKIITLEENVCRIHGGNCHFIPTYRCDSPSYHQVNSDPFFILLVCRRLSSKNFALN